VTFHRRTGFVLLMTSAAIGLAQPRVCAAQGNAPQPLPRPSGNMSVATAVVQFVDSTRSARGDSSGAGKRALTVQLWYPRSPTKQLTTGQYIPDPRMLEALARNNPDSATIHAWKTVEIAALIDVEPMALPWKLPLIIVSHAPGVTRSSYTALSQDVASYGNIVATIDGGVITEDVDTTAAGRARAAVVWAADAAFVATALRGLNNSKTAPTLLKHAAYLTDWDKVGMVGHGLGGLAALEACRRDKRFKACVSLGGEPSEDAAAVGRPVLLMRTEGQSPGSAEKTLAARTDVPAVILQIAGMTPASFSDYAFVYPQAVARASAKSIAANRGFLLTSAFVRAFFDCYLQGRPTELLREGRSQFSEVTISVLTPATKKPCVPVR
jgi:dienelactone hydrolase